MTPFRHLASCVAIIAAAAATTAGPAEPASPSTASSPRCEVWQRELDFARAVAEHDPVAFAEHLHPQAAFGVGRKATVGRAQVTAEWQGIIAGSEVKLEWYPDIVTMGGDGRTAYSSGPTLYVDPNTGAARRGRFGSVWQRDDDDAWRVIFDDGSRPEAVDAAAVRAFEAGQAPHCGHA